MNDSYLTIDHEARVQTKVKGSRFIGETCLITDAPVAMERLGAIRKREYNATHHCWAYQAGREPDLTFKYSDDGEPSGTAGRPIYDVLEGSGISNLLIVVTRYFGGTKLGTGGLVRAYGEAARLAVLESGAKTHYILRHYKLDMDFHWYNQIQRLLNDLEVDVTESEFTDRVSLEIGVRASRAERFERSYVELTQGKATIVETTGQD